MPVTCAVCHVRERVMSRENADTYSAFAFPPLAVCMSVLAARAAAAFVLRCVSPKEGSISRATPLLPEQAHGTACPRVSEP